MTWKELLRACWRMYPADMVMIVSLSLACGIILAVCVFALVWSEK